MPSGAIFFLFVWEGFPFKGNQPTDSFVPWKSTGHQSQGPRGRFSGPNRPSQFSQLAKRTCLRSWQEGVAPASARSEILSRLSALFLHVRLKESCCRHSETTVFFVEQKVGVLRFFACWCDKWGREAVLRFPNKGNHQLGGLYRGHSISHSLPVAPIASLKDKQKPGRFWLNSEFAGSKTLSEKPGNPKGHGMSPNRGPHPSGATPLSSGRWGIRGSSTSSVAFLEVSYRSWTPLRARFEASRILLQQVDHLVFWFDFVLPPFGLLLCFGGGVSKRKRIISVLWEKHPPNWTSNIAEIRCWELSKGEPGKRGPQVSHGTHPFRPGRKKDMYGFVLVEKPPCWGERKTKGARSWEESKLFDPLAFLGGFMRRFPF